ncbi:hypothetical protein BB561_002557 [Smittium simulii]|uniref:acetylornithine transaminase n=1 Tax=Smittium simulii TaxID=133385 RepID=A0A2T9YQ50_9FUNG|nr:hypothetical protein BB561_002557 [Smittium simulii]
MLSPAFITKNQHFLALFPKGLAPAFKTQAYIKKYNSKTNSCLNYTTSSESKQESATLESVSSEIQGYSNYMLNTYKKPNFFLEKGEGCYLFDSSGKKHLDFTAGIAVVALGHSNPQISEIISTQSKKLVHVSNLFYTREACQLAKSLVEATLKYYPQGKVGIYEPTYTNSAPTPKVFFTNSGTEANEGAIKFARKYGKIIANAGKVRVSQNNILKTEPNLKYHMHSFIDGFHGRSTGSLALTPNPKYQDPYTPLIPGVTFSRFNETKELNTFINELTCGVIVEPVQGEGGINTASIDFLKAVRRRCDEVGAVLIYDEIQCGLARTGNFWAHHAYPPECSPDIVTFAKPLGNGFPIGAILVSDKIAQTVNVGDHGTTFGGNPLGCAVGNYVVSQLSQQEFLSTVKENGNYLKQKLNNLASPYMGNQIKDVRGTGLIQGIEFKSSPSHIVKRAQELCLLLVEASKNTIRFVPPLIVTKAQIDDAVRILDQIFKETFSN